jgi:hypothetical protein
MLNADNVISAVRRTGRSARSRQVFFLALFVVLAIGCLGRVFNHDEEQFVASGALLSRAGLLPHLHYPYFHLPNLTFVFGALFLTNDWLLLTARAFNASCAALLLVLIYRLAADAFRAAAEDRWTLAVVGTLALALNPVFRFTIGRAWNHDLAMLAAVAAFAAFLRAARGDGNSKWIAVSGLLLGVAVGTRLTYLPLVLPFAVLTVIYRPKGAAGLRSVSIFCGALLIALAPTLLLFWATPAQFLFDNFSANGPVNLLFRQAQAPENVTLAKKLFFPLRMLFRSPFYLALAVTFVVYGCWFPLRRGWRATLASPAITGILLIVPFALVAAMVPTPSFRQYYYILMPFLVLGAVFGIAHAAPKWNRTSARAVLIILSVGAIEFIVDLHQSALWRPPSRWPVWDVHQTGVEIRRHVESGRVLTLAPILPLEGGLAIYEEFCTGSFAWRLAPFVQEADRVRFRLPDPANLDAHLREPPAAIVTRERAVEEPLIEYARRHRYSPMRLRNGADLWLWPDAP